MNLIAYFFFYSQRIQLLRYFCYWKHTISILIDYFENIFRTWSFWKISNKFLYGRQIWIRCWNRCFFIVFCIASCIHLFLFFLQFLFQILNSLIEFLNFFLFFLIIPFPIPYFLLYLPYQNSIRLLLLLFLFFHSCFFYHILILHKLFLFLTCLQLWVHAFFLQLLHFSFVILLNNIFYFLLLLDSPRFHFHILKTLPLFWEFNFFLVYFNALCFMRLLFFFVFIFHLFLQNFFIFFFSFFFFFHCFFVLFPLFLCLL